ncbi:MAG TPA: hypothetical protein DCS07_17860 [Bdellovibrionales bacterium]|nr:MAG: hypothetical protein A2Z97_05415 [Bdellovibrionales bacterium GWB1_52_6]OFZ05708.1 MAG: hypothetical protein A2X97_03320 [Bdellovibrionales bacterium GWA1_52_35]OFZ40657.1 MAG: hypothetical protein A2070_06325 [Bdellovibrionales bacterium GWC1_52_8]HAR44468.1 hypothetical protein [Bdellovibrionales bacterium]HCM40354.1 hypothetical protein [Bdellovibrionales bacterium]
MDSNLITLSMTAAGIGFIHTLAGPDHYLPFIVFAKAQNWSLKKTWLITFLSGLGHVLASVLLGCVGIGLGLALDQIMPFEMNRGTFAAWAITTFGFVYLVWGLKHSFRSKTHQHVHFHEVGPPHTHSHSHLDTPHLHVHAASVVADKPSFTPWVLFTLLVFGPCEPLIPILMYPAATHSIAGLVMVTSVFFFSTVTAMLLSVTLGYLGVQYLNFTFLERHTHALAGGSVFLCGIGIIFFGM